ncbi:hypothetical protein L228DRAFT_263397 [Xylona heveae TC161]|uniref:DNA polymerase epsilon subunit B n=1 Tax=Xylona heveae (strain CBS 132557 / TC161) TaxID=1328760 RepID=A0A165A8L5_XYLHT|nr:hypothetical protein L228DRAFT_263397 [Xylona heveae TC161]KZF20098.1 hypothetical protein L228DRAFT_263397 [Xylona heveae TC161]
MRPHQTPSRRTAPLFRPPHTPASHNPIPSSSPAFGTPVHPPKPYAPKDATSTKQTILPILLPPPTLRPLAFRTFTKKHNLTLSSSALQALASFIGTHCGAGWREQGLAEKVLEEVAKSWKKLGGPVIVDGESAELQTILKNIEGAMSGGRIQQGKSLSRQNSFAFGDGLEKLAADAVGGGSPGSLEREDSQASFGLSALGMDEEEEELASDPRKWLKVISAFEQPRLFYNVAKKHFERANAPPSLLASASQKTQLFRHRYDMVYQRLLRNESFQVPSLTPARSSLLRSTSNMATIQQAYKLTAITNLLGRSGTSHLLLGLLTIAPTGNLAINDLTGSIALDLTHARPVPEDGAWFAPGMIVLVDGIYEEDSNPAAEVLGGGGGIGGTIGGKFVGFSVGGPPCERRETSLGISLSGKDGDVVASGGFGWIDFLGVGSERAVGSRMRRIEDRVLRLSETGQEDGDDEEANSNHGRERMIILGEVNLDQMRTLDALRKVFEHYSSESSDNVPMTVVLMGNFVQHAVMAGGGSGGSIEYKEYFDALASTLSDFPTLLQHSTFIFVPGDNDPWASALSAGAATAIPRKNLPELFTSRIKRAFASAAADAERATGRKPDAEVIWTSNPSRLSLFGPTQEIVLFRDDISARFRRNAITFRPVPQQTLEPDPDAPAGDIVMADGAAPAPSQTEATPGVDDTEAGQEAQNSNPAQGMDVDHAVEAAESHTPAPAGRPNELSDGVGVDTTTASNQVSLDTQTARKLVKTILDQGYLSPFPLSIRPVIWDFATALELYPLPTALVLADQDAPPFTVTYEGCHVMNPGKLVAPDRKGIARWIEYDARTRRGQVKEVSF